MRKIKKWICMFLSILCMFQFNSLSVKAEDYWPEGPEVSGPSAIVMEAFTGTVLYEKNSHEHLYPASITKIMTSLLALENCSLDEIVTFSHDSVYKIEGTHIGRDVGEEMTMEQCLYAVLLGSANEVSYAVAEHVGEANDGTSAYDNFIKMMNEKATELGCTDTHFNNPHGLPDDNHYTSAYDMALISREALKNEMFCNISKTKMYTIPITNKHPNDETYIPNHHKMINAYKGDQAQLYEYCIGGKTGYTSVAGSTLVTYAEKDGMTLICVVMKEEGSNHYIDTRALFDYCFENFQLWNISDNEVKYAAEGSSKSEIFGNNENFVDLNRSGQIVLPKTASFTDAKPSISHENVSEKIVATLQYTYADRVVGGTDIEVTGVKVQQFPFDAIGKDLIVEEEEKVFNVNIKYVVVGAAILILIIAFGIGIYFFADNFYLIKYKLSSRKGRKFKEIKGSEFKGIKRLEFRSIRGLKGNVVQGIVGKIKSIKSKERKGPKFKGMKDSKFSLGFRNRKKKRK
ncbi:D-alanyl-D-alanine carboxypeptidase [Lachnospiraceae bacterium ZAX-1]